MISSIADGASRANEIATKSGLELLRRNASFFQKNGKVTLLTLEDIYTRGTSQGESQYRLKTGQ